MPGIPPDKIEAQLKRILVSPTFMTGKKVSQFLRYVVKQALNGQPAIIKQYTIAVEALGYETDFDPSTNPTVRVVARRLRRSLHEYYSEQGIEDPIHIDIPKGSYVPVITLNHDNPQDTESACESQFSIPATIKQQDAVQDGPSIAILPFEYLGYEPEYAYIASGITEEVVIALTRFQEFFVVGPLNRDIIRQNHLEPRDIGQEYSVRFLLDGTVRMRGGTLHLTAKLTDTLNGRKFWGQTHDHDIERTSIDQLEHEIVGQVVATIADNYGVIPRTMAKEVLSHHHDSLSDYEAIMRYHHHCRTLTEKSLTEAIEAMEKVVQRDPDHDLAMALLGDLITGPYWLGYTDSQYDLGRATELGKRALALNPNSQPAHLTMAIIYYFRLQKELYLEEIEQVLNLNPNNAHYLAVSALFMMGIGQKEEGLALIGKAMHLNPHHVGWYFLDPFLYHYYQGEYEAALLEANRFNTPEYFWDPLIRTAVLGCLGSKEEAERAGVELLALVPDFKIRGQSLIQRMVYSEENTEMLLDGLHKAGLDMKIKE